MNKEELAQIASKTAELNRTATTANQASQRPCSAPRRGGATSPRTVHGLRRVAAARGRRSAGQGAECTGTNPVAGRREDRREAPVSAGS